MTKKAFDKVAKGLTDGLAVARGQRFDCVWRAIEDTPGQAEIMRLRSDLMIAIAGHIQRKRLTQRRAAALFGTSPQRIADLTHGRIQLFTLDALVGMLAAAGMHVEMRVLEAA
jgi:predicted XRE-type DNA-binding protein